MGSSFKDYLEHVKKVIDKPEDYDQYYPKRLSWEKLREKYVNIPDLEKIKKLIEEIIPKLCEEDFSVSIFKLGRKRSIVGPKKENPNDFKHLQKYDADQLIALFRKSLDTKRRDVILSINFFGIIKTIEFNMIARKEIVRLGKRINDQNERNYKRAMEKLKKQKTFPPGELERREEVLKKIYESFKDEIDRFTINIKKYRERINHLVNLIPSYGGLQQMFDERLKEFLFNMENIEYEIRAYGKGFPPHSIRFHFEDPKELSKNVPWLREVMK